MLVLCPFSVKISISLWRYFACLWKKTVKYFHCDMWCYIWFCVSFVQLLLTLSDRFWNRKSYCRCLLQLDQGNWAACFHFRIQSNSFSKSIYGFISYGLSIEHMRKTKALTLNIAPKMFKRFADDIHARLNNREQ